MMPLIATLPGTEKIPASLFNDFFEKLEEKYHPGDRGQLNRLDMLIRWLAGQTSLELALEQVSIHEHRFSMVVLPVAFYLALHRVAKHTRHDHVSL